MELVLVVLMILVLLLAAWLSVRLRDAEVRLTDLEDAVADLQEAEPVPPATARKSTLTVTPSVPK